MGKNVKNNRRHKKVGKQQQRVSDDDASAKKNTLNLDLLRVQMSNPNPKNVGPFNDRVRILTVGDGDLSFSLALATQLGGKNIVATTYDTFEELHDKYDSFRSNYSGLKSTGAMIHEQVDCTQLSQQSWLQNHPPFHFVVFNFPHVGGSTEKDVVQNQIVLKKFFHSVRPFVDAKRGNVIVSLRKTPFYDSWKIRDQAIGFELNRIEPFQAELYSGYTPQRTHPAFREPPSTQGAQMFFFKPGKMIRPIDSSNIVSVKQKSIVKDTKQKMNCTVCGVNFVNIRRYNGHMNSAKHARKVKQLKKT